MWRATDSTRGGARRRRESQRHAAIALAAPAVALATASTANANTQAQAPEKSEPAVIETIEGCCMMFARDDVVAADWFVARRMLGARAERDDDLAGGLRCHGTPERDKLVIVARMKTPHGLERPEGVAQLRER